MSLALQIALAILFAGAIAAAGPYVCRRLPEPAHPAANKMPYREVAQLRHAGLIQVVSASLAAGLLAARVGKPELLGVWVLFASVGSWLAWIDWHTLYLPYRLTAALYGAIWVAVGVAAAINRDSSMLIRTAILNAVVYAVFWLIYLVGQRFGNALGFGDVRLAAIIAVALGPLGASTVFAGIYAGFVFGAVGTVILRRLRIISGSNFAFGPYLWLGAVVGAALIR